MSKQYDVQTITQILKSHKLRVTPQRFAVYANLLARADHPTVEQILTDLNRDAPVSSKATVYSSLQALREVKLVREVLLEEGVSRYDANVEPHHHFLCVKCGAIHDLPWDTFENLDLKQLPNDFVAESYEVTVRGRCGSCGE